MGRKPLEREVRAGGFEREDASPEKERPPSAPMEDATALLFDAIDALEALRTGIDEVATLVSAAARLAAEAPNDPEAIVRIARRLGFLIILASRRGDALEEQAAALVPGLLERFASTRG